MIDRSRRQVKLQDPCSPQMGSVRTSMSPKQQVFAVAPQYQQRMQQTNKFSMGITTGPSDRMKSIQAKLDSVLRASKEVQELTKTKASSSLVRSPPVIERSPIRSVLRSRKESMNKITSSDSSSESRSKKDRKSKKQSKKQSRHHRSSSSSDSSSSQHSLHSSSSSSSSSRSRPLPQQKRGEKVRRVSWKSDSCVKNSVKIGQKGKLREKSKKKHRHQRSSSEEDDSVFVHNITSFKSSPVGYWGSSNMNVVVASAGNEKVRKAEERAKKSMSEMNRIFEDDRKQKLKAALLVVRGIQQTGEFTDTAENNHQTRGRSHKKKSSSSSSSSSSTLGSSSSKSSSSSDSANRKYKKKSKYPFKLK